MTIGELLEFLDGAGLVITDEYLIEAELNSIGLSVNDTIQKEE